MELPHFIIGGAAKAGTTTLHSVLQRHPNIALPVQELHFFSADDPAIHPNFFRQQIRTFHWKDPDAADAGRWYRAQFDNLGDALLKGEDTPAYLHSFVAARRIRNINPDVKLIFALRDPVDRAVSQYWHMVRTGRTALPFDDAIVRVPQIIRASAYQESILLYTALFPRDQICFFILEKYAREPAATIGTLTNFLGVADFDDVPRIQSNKSSYPTHPWLYRQLNRVRMRLPSGRYGWHMPASSGRVEARDWRRSSIKKFTRNRIYLKLLQSDRRPPVDEEALNFLRIHLRRRNAGLSELIGEDLCSLWPSFRS